VSIEPKIKYEGFGGGPLVGGGAGARAPLKSGPGSKLDLGVDLKSRLKST